MNREQLRAKLLSGADALHNSVAWRFMSAEQRQLSTAGRAFWAADNAVTNAALDAFLTLLHSARATEEQSF